MGLDHACLQKVDVVFLHLDAQKIGKESLFKLETIKSNKEIDLIFKNGEKLNFPFLNLILYKDNKQQINGKVAFLAGKKNGNAVWRNKSKRILREVYKQLNINNDYKCLLIANKNLLNEKFETIVKEVNKEINKNYE